MGKNLWIDISPEKICRWLLSTWKYAQYYWLLGKCKLKPTPILLKWNLPVNPPYQWCVGKYLTIASLRKTRALISSMSQFPFFRYSYHGWYQATHLKSGGGAGKWCAPLAHESEWASAPRTPAPYTPELPPSASPFVGKAHWRHQSTWPAAREARDGCPEKSTHSFILQRNK